MNDLSMGGHKQAQKISQILPLPMVQHRVLGPEWVIAHEAGFLSGHAHKQIKDGVFALFL